MAEEFARLGCEVVGVDPSEVSVDTARRHAQERGLAIEYKVGSGEHLPVEDHSFDITYCCDVLEHVRDLEQVLGETSRVLKPDGVYFFDTVNRTFASYLLAIKVMQEWRFTRIFDFVLHDWSMFIKPAELTAGLSGHGLYVGEIVGLGPRSNPFSIVWDLVKMRRGNLTYAQLSTRMNMGKVKSKSISYMGFATKQPRIAVARVADAGRWGDGHIGAIGP